MDQTQAGADARSSEGTSDIAAAYTVHSSVDSIHRNEELSSRDGDSDDSHEDTPYAPRSPYNNQSVFPIHRLTASTTVSWRARVIHDDGYSDSECVAIYEKGEAFDFQAQRPAAVTRSTTGNVWNAARNESDNENLAFHVETEVFERGFVTDTAARGQLRFTNNRYPKKNDFTKLRFTRYSPPNLLIASEVLDLALRLILKESPQYPDGLVDDVPFVRSPYICLMHHYELIGQFADGHDIEQILVSGNENEAILRLDKDVAVRHMKALRDYLKPQYEKSVLPLSRDIASSEPKVTFDMVWYLFPSGSEVYVRFGDETHASIVRKVDLYQPRKQDKVQSDAWDLELWYLATDGNRIARSTELVSIDRFDGSKDIRSLPVCPVSIIDKQDGGELRARLIRRRTLHVSALRAGKMHVHYDGTDQNGRKIKGKMVVDYINPSFNDKDEMGYKSPDFDAPETSHPSFESYNYIYVRDSEASHGEERYLDRGGRYRSRGARSPSPTPDPPRFRGNNIRGYNVESSSIRTRVSQRKAQLRNYQPRSSVNPLLKSRYETQDISEHQLLLLDPVAPAFSLTTKQWHLINVEFMQAVEATENSINHLVMDESALLTIRALASRRHKADESWSADFIEGKGVGQIILLHGPPGVGKTFTVESIAEWLQRPLLALTVADIGTQEMRIEQELMKWFELAEAWEGVVLVDEADIFLEQRKTRDLARNGLVTALLRRMEYFKGLLFLTTNRVGQIDDAFMSRVHTAIEYKTLSPEAREKIWNGFFDKLRHEQKSRIIVARNAKKYVEDRKAELNGREIRNVLQTAISLAAFQAELDPGRTADEPVVVEESHFKDVLDMSEKFHKYVTAIRDQDLEHRAFVREERVGK